MCSCHLQLSRKVFQGLHGFPVERGTGIFVEGIDPG